MKKLVLFFAFSSFLFAANAQETEGYLQYSIDVQAVDTSMKAKQQAGMLRNSKMEIFFTQNFSRVDFEMGQLYKLSAVVDLETNTTLSLMSGSIGKFATRTLTEDTTNLVAVPESSIELIDESKVILEYNCKKAIVTVNGMESVYWYTDEVDIDISGQQISNSLIPGFPLEFYTVAEGVMMHFTASNIEFELEDKETLFYTEVPQGYVIMQDIGQ